MTVDIDLDHLAEVVFVRCLHGELILLIAAPPHCALRTGVGVCSLHPRSGEPCPPLLECGVYIHFFFFFLLLPPRGRMCLLPHGSIHPVVFRIDQHGPMGLSPAPRHCPPTLLLDVVAPVLVALSYPHPCVSVLFSFLVFPCFSALQNDPGLSENQSQPYNQPFLEGAGSFSWRTASGTKARVLGVLRATSA